MDIIWEKGYMRFGYVINCETMNIIWTRFCRKLNWRIIFQKKNNFIKLFKLTSNIFWNSRNLLSCLWNITSRFHLNSARKNANTRIIHEKANVTYTYTRTIWLRIAFYFSPVPAHNLTVTFRAGHFFYNFGQGTGELGHSQFISIRTED